MIYPIEIKDIVGNALIEIVERTGRRFILFSKLNNYINAITKQLECFNIDTLNNINHEETDRFLDNYDNLFEIIELPDDIRIDLKTNISSSDLRKHFRVSLPLNVLNAFIAEESVQALITEMEL